MVKAFNFIILWNNCIATISVNVLIKFLLSYIYILIYAYLKTLKCKLASYTHLYFTKTPFCFYFN